MSFQLAERNKKICSPNYSVKISMNFNVSSLDKVVSYVKFIKLYMLDMIAILNYICWT